MKIARLIAPVHSLGPGDRLCLWVQGCTKQCVGCISPEMQSFIGEDIPEDMLSKILMRVAQNGNCKALTISGGDPLEQSSSLLFLLKNIRMYFEDILVYTGFTLEEVKNGASGEDGKNCLKYIDVLIDGRYIDNLNEHECVLRGSSNQKIHFLNPLLKEKYNNYMKKGRMLECFTLENKTVITGIISKEMKT